jgi:hypothetical protein
LDSSEGKIPLLISQSFFALAGLWIDELNRGGGHGNSTRAAHMAGN